MLISVSAVFSNNNNNNNEYICNGQFKQSSNAPLLHYRAGVKKGYSFRENVWMDDVSLSSAGRLFQMTAADTANALAPTTVLVRRTDSFMVSAERRRRRPATVETKIQSSAKYDGARPCMSIEHRLCIASGS